MSQEPPLFQLRAEQKRLETAARSLELELSEVNTSLVFVNAQIARITNRNAPIYSLPNEIITAIFNAGIPNFSPASDYSSSICKRFPIVASHITHHLREVVLSSPSLWRRIRVSSARSLDQVNTYLHRSKGCFLEIMVNMTRGEFHFPQSLLSHITRWRSLRII